MPKTRISTLTAASRRLPTDLTVLLCTSLLFSEHSVMCNEAETLEQTHLFRFVRFGVV